MASEATLSPRLVVGWIAFRAPARKEESESRYLTSRAGQLSLAVTPRIGTISTGDAYGGGHTARNTRNSGIADKPRNAFGRYATA